VRRGRRLTSCLLFVSGSALALLLSQIVLYNGDITPHTRYEFPAALAGPALLAAASVCVRSFLRRTGALRAERAVYPVMAAVFLTLALLNVEGFREQRDGAVVGPPRPETSPSGSPRRRRQHVRRQTFRSSS
jgi:hypothetical protein